MWWWLRLVAVVVLGTALSESPLVLPWQCKEIDQYQSSPLPTNFSIKPLSSSWHLNFTLRDHNSSPVACIYFEEEQGWTEVQLLRGECNDTGTTLSLEQLQNNVKHNIWTTFDVRVQNKELHMGVKELQGENITLKRDYLPQEGWQITVTETHDVEAVVGCAVECQEQYYASREPGMRIKVGEWQQNPHHFYYKSESSNSSLLYEFICTESEETELKNDVEIKVIAGDWYFLELKQNPSNISVYSNGESLKLITIPKSCNSTRHVIWMPGDGYFCTRDKESPATPQDKEKPVTSPDRDTIHHNLQIANIVISSLTLVFIIIFVTLSFKKEEGCYESVES